MGQWRKGAKWPVEVVIVELAVPAGGAGARCSEPITYLGWRKISSSLPLRTWLEGYMGMLKLVKTLAFLVFPCVIERLDFTATPGDVLGILGTQRRQQVDAVQPDSRCVAAERRTNSVRGTRHHPVAAMGSLSCAGDRSHLSGPLSVRPQRRCSRMCLVAAVHGAGLLPFQLAPDERRPRSWSARASRVGAAFRRGDLGLFSTRKQLELAKALAVRPRLLLLDEIAGGLTEAETETLLATIKVAHAGGVMIVWIEHVVQALRRLVSRPRGSVRWPLHR